MLARRQPRCGCRRPVTRRVLAPWPRGSRSCCFRIWPGCGSSRSLSQPPPASPVPSRLCCDSLFLFSHFATSLPIALGRLLRKSGRLLHKWLCCGAGKGGLARKFKPRLSPGSHQSCESGVFGWVPAVPRAEQRLREGTAVSGSLGVLQPSAGRLPGLPRRTSSPLLATGARQSLAKAFAFVLSAFPCKERPCSQREGPHVYVGAGRLTSPSLSPLPPCLFHFGEESPSIFSCEEEPLIKSRSLPGRETLRGWWESARKRSRSWGGLEVPWCSYSPAPRCWRRRPARPRVRVVRDANTGLMKPG